MDYIIQQILPTQIVVEFKGGKRAVVPVSSTDTAEQIDIKVSYYDSEYISEEKTTTNPNIEVGELRQSKRPEETVGENFNPLENCLRNFYLFFRSYQLALRGDNEGMDKLTQIIDSVYGELDKDSLMYNYSDLLGEVSNFVSTPIPEQAEDIFETALQELEAGE